MPLTPMTLGPLMLDVVGTELTDDDRHRLTHPSVGGVILFTRNYRDPTQLSALIADLRALKSPPLLIAVDHEGGRVQRFREGFTRLPTMRALGTAWDTDAAHARELARDTGYILAAELRAVGVDFSFAPVLDLDYGASSVIGDRSFHADPAVVAELALAVMQGMGDAGMAAVGKHFPGHGFVVADSHVAMPVDERDFAAIAEADLQPFRDLIDAGIAAIMPAHVVYPAVDAAPAGFSKIWLGEILRGQLGFTGAIVSDDLCMAGAATAGGVVARVRAAMDAGCDLALVCNRPDLADQVLRELVIDPAKCVPARLERLRGQPAAATRATLSQTPRYIAAQQRVADLVARQTPAATLAQYVDPTQYQPKI